MQKVSHHFVCSLICNIVEPLKHLLPFAAKW